MKEPVRSPLLVFTALLAGCSCALAEDVILTAPGWDHINASALDQPEQDGVLTDNGSVICEDGDPVILDFFVDTGASSFVISYLNAVGYDYEPIAGFGYDRIPSLGLDGTPPGEFVGSFTEVGIGGYELGDVTRPLGVRLLNAPQGSSLDPDDFCGYGEHNLWVRRDIGIGEVIVQDFLTLVDPVNVVGMPIISQRVLVMDPRPMADLERLGTLLVPEGDPNIPQTNVTFDVFLADLVPSPPPGEVPPSSRDNPLIRHVTISHTSGGQTLSDANNSWLFDTGSGSTFVSFAKAQAVGLIDESYLDVNDYLPHHVAAGGLVNEVGGIGPGTVTAPILRLNEIRIPAKEGFDVVWCDVEVMVVDIEDPNSPGQKLSGVMGMNLLVPAVTVDPDDPLGSLDEISPGFFDAIVFDPTDPNKVELRGWTELAPPPPIPGDADRSGYVDDDDLSVLLGNWGPTAGDLSGDGVVADDDLSILLGNWAMDVTPEQGDLSGDGTVGDDDLSMLLANWGLEIGWGQGDFGGDGIVADDDLSILLGHWGEGIPPPSENTIPEPGTIALLVLGAPGLLRRRR